MGGESAVDDDVTEIRFESTGHQFDSTASIFRRWPPRMSPAGSRSAYGPVYHGSVVHHVSGVTSSSKSGGSSL